MAVPAASGIDATAAPASVPQPEPRPAASLATGTPVLVMLDQDLSTMTAVLGDRFSVVVLHDVVDQDTVVIPQGTTGYGEVTFTTNKGGFGKPGIIGIALRHLQLGDRQVALSGRYREEGQSKAGVTAATYFAVGVFAGFIKGKPGIIPKGRELKARTGEAIAFTPGLSAVAPPRAGPAIPPESSDPVAPPRVEPATSPEIQTENPASHNQQEK